MPQAMGSMHVLGFFWSIMLHCKTVICKIDYMIKLDCHSHMHYVDLECGILMIRNLQNLDGKTPLKTARSNNQDEVIQLLESHIDDTKQWAITLNILWYSKAIVLMWSCHQFRSVRNAITRGYLTECPSDIGAFLKVAFLKLEAYVAILRMLDSLIILDW